MYFKMKVKWGSFPIIVLRKFVASRAALWEMLADILQIERNATWWKLRNSGGNKETGDYEYVSEHNFFS